MDEKKFYIAVQADTFMPFNDGFYNGAYAAMLFDSIDEAMSEIAAWYDDEVTDVDETVKFYEVSETGARLVKCKRFIHVIRHEWINA